jgi:hypothetical protein
MLMPGSFAAMLLIPIPAAITIAQKKSGATIRNVFTPMPGSVAATLLLPIPVAFPPNKKNPAQQFVMFLLRCRDPSQLRCSSRFPLHFHRTKKIRRNNS